MTVNRTTLLDLPLPVTGTEAGTWGDVTNNGLTQYLDVAIAGMSNLTSANFTTGALTIETTEGDSIGTNITATSAQYAGFRVSSLAQNSIITVGNTGTNPARSYRLINADATYTLTFKATGQNGITLQPGQTAVVAFNGTDYVIVGMAGAGTVTDNAVVRFDGTTGKLVQNSVVTIADSTGDISGVGTLNATTADLTNLEVTNIKAKDGTAAGSIADSTGVVTLGSSVLTTTDINGGTIDNTAIGGATPAAGAFTTLSASSTVTLSGGTANGVAYLNGSKVLTTGSALTFDGSANFSFTGSGLYPVISVAPTGNNAIFGFRMDASAGNGIDWRVEQGRSAVGDFNISAPAVNASPQYVILKDLSAQYWSVGAAGQKMRLTSAGLEIGGTFNQGRALNVDSAADGYTVSLLQTDASSSGKTSGIVFAGYYDGSSITDMASIRGGKENTTSGDYGGKLAFYTRPNGGADTERARFDSGGDFMIGTTSSSGRLTVVTGAGSQAALFSCGSGTTQQAVATFSNSTNGGYLSIAGVGTSSAVGTWTNGSMVVEGVPFSSGNTFIGSYTGDLVFQNGRSNSGRFNSGGNLLVGTDTAASTERLGVVKSVSNGWVVRAENSSNQSGDQLHRLVLGSNCNNTSSYHLVCTTGGSDRLYIYGNGNVVNSNNSYGSLSDIKHKENITDATPKLAGLNQLRVVNYNLKGDTLKQIGLVAQEVEQVFPGLVDETPDMEEVQITDPETGEVHTERQPTGEITKSIKYSVFVPMLIKAMQEQQTMIDQLKAEVAALKGA